MDFTPSDRVTELLERVNGFLDEHYYPRERELVEALDEEVTRDSGKAYPDAVIELREKARARQGDRFSIKEFHNAVLKAGSVPLPALEAEIARAMP